LPERDLQRWALCLKKKNLPRVVKKTKGRIEAWPLVFKISAYFLDRRLVIKTHG
jgi:hypothetical protein